MEESEEEDAADRIENIEELINKVISYEETHDEPVLSEFLEEVALVADVDRVEEESDRVLLMTLHSAKGLEFPHIYLAGMEDGIFPSYMTITSDDPMEIEEERRLAYVGITRAKDDLTLTCARQRMIRGETQYNLVSRFVKEIPPLLLDNTLPAPKRKEYETYEEDSEETNRFRAKPFSGGTDRPMFEMPAEMEPPKLERPSAPVTTKAFVAKPKAVVRPKRTALENQPYITKINQGVGAVSLEPATGNKRLGYEVGDRVRHMRYGEGTVMRIEPGPRDSQVTVVFDEMGQKIMYAGFAKLQKV